MPQANYDEARAKVARIQRDLDNTIATIRSNRNFTDEARRVEMAKATLNARRQAAELRETTITARQSQRESLERSIFGATTSQEMAELRAASAIAMKLDSDKEASDMLRLAQQRGDTLMARALAQVAAHKGSKLAEVNPGRHRACLSEWVSSHLIRKAI